MRELKRLARNDRERFVVPRSVQRWTPIDEIYPMTLPDVVEVHAPKLYEQ